jgi:septal ring factor EnvC (AmiA/AmiB activator)
MSDTTALYAQIRALQTDTAQCNQNILLLQAQTIALQGDTTALHTQIASLNIQIIALNGQITALEDEKSALQDQIIGLNNQLTALQNDLGDCDNDKTALQNRIIELESDAIALNAQIAALQAALDECNGGLTDIGQIPVAGVDVYPNPVGMELYLRSEYPVDNVEIIDITRRSVGLWPAANLQNGKQSINVSALPAGIYFAKIIIGNRFVTKKFVKK